MGAVFGAGVDVGVEPVLPLPRPRDGAALVRSFTPDAIKAITIPQSLPAPAEPVSANVEILLADLQ
jgi:hypothetical protein